MNSTIPKPPQRIRVEMPTEIAPQPVPEAVLEASTAPEETISTTEPVVPEKLVSNKVHVIHPKKAAEVVVKPAETIAEPQQENLNVPSDEELHKRQYYTIGEVADMFGANQSQIRFWENEFEILQPKKNKKGDRYFRPEDIKNLVLIRHLLQERRFTIEGAREYLKGKAKRLANRHEAIQQLEKLKDFLQEMKANLGEAIV